MLVYALEWFGATQVWSYTHPLKLGFVQQGKLVFSSQFWQKNLRSLLPAGTCFLWVNGKGFWILIVYTCLSPIYLDSCELRAILPDLFQIWPDDHARSIVITGRGSDEEVPLNLMTRDPGCAENISFFYRSGGLNIYTRKPPIIYSRILLPVRHFSLNKIIQAGRVKKSFFFGHLFFNIINVFCAKSRVRYACICPRMVTV